MSDSLHRAGAGAVQDADGFSSDVSVVLSSDMSDIFPEYCSDDASKLVVKSVLALSHTIYSRVK